MNFQSIEEESAILLSLTQSIRRTEELDDPKLRHKVFVEQMLVFLNLWKSRNQIERKKYLFSSDVQKDLATIQLDVENALETALVKLSSWIDRQESPKHGFEV